MPNTIGNNVEIKLSLKNICVRKKRGGSDE